jgi:hypothetical protein
MPGQPIDLPTIADKPITMNLLKLPSLITTSLALLTFHASAVEYVTLRGSTQVVNLDPKDIVEIVSVPVWSYASPPNFAQLEVAYIDVKFDGADVFQNLQTARGHILTSLVGISAQGVVTIKITRANEVNAAQPTFNAVQPTSVLIIPENATGNYDIVVETSDDTATWTPFHSQTVLATDPKRFFRTRIVRRD